MNGVRMRGHPSPVAAGGHGKQPPAAFPRSRAVRPPPQSQLCALIPIPAAG